MNTIKKSRLLGIFLVITIILFQFQSILAVTELNTLRFTAYKLGGAGDEMNYGNGREWGRGNLTFHNSKPDSTLSVGSDDCFTIKFSVENECQPFYCVELGAPLANINGDDYSKNGKSYWDTIESNGKINGSQIGNYLGEILYYGFHNEFNYTDGNLWNVDYPNNIDNINKYIATQILIWETIYGYRDDNFAFVSWPGLNEPLDYISSSPNLSQIKSYYNSIVYSIKSCGNIPSFMYETEQEALNNSYKVPYSEEQELFATSIEDKNSKLKDYGISYDNSKIYIDNLGTANRLNVSIPKDTKSKSTDPLILKLNDNSSFTSAAIITWTNGSKQNGITWGGPVTTPVSGYAAFYPGEYYPPKSGSIKIKKEGDAFTTLKKEKIDDYNVTKPVFSSISLSNITFSLYAFTDIYLDDELQFRAGEFIENQKTDSNGVLSFNGLGTGVYEIIEIFDSYNSEYLRTGPIYVELDYNKQTNAIDRLELNVNNTFCKALVRGEKLFEISDPNIEIDMEEEMNNVIIGLYSNEDIYGYDKVVIPKNTLIDISGIDSDYQFEFDTPLPKGKYYVKELQGSEHFVTDTEIHYFDCETDNYLEYTFNIAPIIINETSIINGWKMSENKKPLKGAVIGLYKDSKCKNKIAEFTTNDDGYFEFDDLPVGEYYLKELKAPKGYELSNDIYKVYSHQRDEDGDIIITNKPEKKATPTPTNTPTPTVTPTSTPVPTVTPTSTPVPSNTPTPTVTPTSTPVPTVTPTSTPVPSNTPTPTVTPTSTPVPTITPTSTPVPSNTPTPTVTPTSTPVPTNTPIPTVTPTSTPVPSNTPVPMITPTNTPVPTATPTCTPIPTNTPTSTPVPTNTPIPTSTPTSTPVPTNTPVPETPGIVVTSTPTPNPTPTEAITVTPEITVTETFENPPKFEKPPKSDSSITQTGENESLTTMLGKSILLSLVITFMISKSYKKIVNRITED